MKHWKVDKGERNGRRERKIDWGKVIIGPTKVGRGHCAL